MERSEIFTGILVALLIFLTVVLLFATLESAGYQSDRWSILTNGSPEYQRSIYVSDNGTIYLWDGKAIRAIDQDGRQEWQSAMPAVDENSTGSDNQLILDSVAMRDGYLYLYLESDQWSMSGCDGEVVALAPNGTLFWQVKCPASRFAEVTFSGDTIYVSRDGPDPNDPLIQSLAAYDTSGNILWTNDDVYLSPVFDDNGTAYLIHGDRIPIYSEELLAYSQNGTMLWSRNLSDQGIHTPLALQAYNGSLYVESYDGFGAYSFDCLDSDGLVRWKRDVDRYYMPVTFDAEGNMYLQETGSIEVISHDGRDLGIYSVNVSPGYVEANDNGTLYISTLNMPASNASLEDLAGYRLDVVDLKNQRMLWSYDFKPVPDSVVTVRRDTASSLIQDFQDIPNGNTMNATELQEYYDIQPGTTENEADDSFNVYPYKDHVYVSFWSANYEEPVVYNQTKCAYSGSLYAFDRSGNLLWKKQLDSYVDYLVEKNDTVYYSTGDGRFSASDAGLTAGLVTAAAYLFFRFLVVGAVARARSRLEQNENRNGILKFISANPGSTLYDIGRGLSLNVGTVRYHLLILSVNRKIRADRNAAGSVRYYANGRQYSVEEKLVISLMKRSQVGRLLKTLIEQPGLPNTEISRALGLPESAVSRYLRELADHGVVVKQRTESGKLSYIVDDKYRHAILGYLRAGPVSLDYPNVT